LPPNQTPLNDPCAVTEKEEDQDVANITFVVARREGGEEGGGEGNLSIKHMQMHGQSGNLVNGCLGYHFK
jgi:hypothetical protein